VEVVDGIEVSVKGKALAGAYCGECTGSAPTQTESAEHGKTGRPGECPNKLCKRTRVYCTAIEAIAYLTSLHFSQTCDQLPNASKSRY
jgi:hypothetical protein